MPKKLQINAIPQGKVKLNLTYDGAGCCFAQGLSPGWGLQLAAGPGSPVAGLGAVNVCGERRPGSTWSHGGQTLGWVRDFHQFSLKKSPCPSSNTPPRDGSLQLILTQPCCCGQWFGGVPKRRWGATVTYSPGWRRLGERGCREVGSHVHQPSTVGRSRRWSQQGGRCPFPCQRVRTGHQWPTGSRGGTRRGLATGVKLSLRAPSRQGNGATGCQCSLCEHHACRKK